MTCFEQWSGPVTVGVWVLAIGSTGAFAQAPAAAPPLSLQQAIDEALASNPDLQALAREYERAQLVADTTRGFAPPMFEAGIWRWPISTVNPANTEMYMFSVTQALPARGRREREAGLAGADAALAEASIAVRARGIVNAIQTAWADVYLARESLETNRETLALVRQFADVATSRYSTGEAAQQDALAAIVELSRLHEDAVRLTEAERLATARLNVLLARRPESPLGPLVAPPAPPTLPSSAELQDLALGHEPGLRRAALDVARAEASFALSLADNTPEFRIGGGYMLMPRMGDAWMASVGISWPRAPWSRGRIEARQAVAAAEVARREADRRAAENDVRLAVHEAFVRADSAAARVVLIESSILPQAEQAIMTARAGYESGRGSFLALIDSQRVLVDIRLDLHRARAERARALADLERAAGVDLVPAGRPTVPSFIGGRR